MSDDTTTNKVDAVGDTPGLLVESVMVTPARGGLAYRATDSGDLMLSKAATGEEGCAYDPTNTATATGTIVDGKTSCLQVALPSDLLQSPRVEHRIEGTADVDIFRVEGKVGGDPRMWGFTPSVGLIVDPFPAQQVERGTTVAATAIKDPLLPCTGNGLLADSCETMITIAAAQAALGTCKEVEHLLHSQASTLEMISAMAHMPASVPPDCIQGVEMSTPAKTNWPASSSPGRIWTRAGIYHRATDDDGHHNHEIPSLRKQEKVQGTEGGTTRRVVATPYESLLKSFSWAGGDESIDAASRYGGVASQALAEQRQGRGGEDPQETCCAENLQLHVTETLGNGLGRASPGKRGGGGVGGEDKQPMTTPFSR